MTGSSRNSKATSSRSSKRSERLSSSVRTTQGVARRARLYSARDERGKRGEPRRFFHHQTLARAYTISKPAGKFDWRFHCVQQGTHDDHDQPSERINPIFCMKNGEIGQHATGLLCSVHGNKCRRRSQKADPHPPWHLKRPRVMVDGPPVLAKVRAPTERCLSKIAH